MIRLARVCCAFLFIAGARAAVVAAIDSQAAGMEYLVDRARALAEREYPKMAALLCEDPRQAPVSFRITFKPIASLDTAQTGGNPASIVINSDYFARRPGQTNWMARHPHTFDMVLLHEMAHVIQQYGRKVPKHWAEGMADYARYRLGHTNGWSGPSCTNDYRHYRSGYHCAGAFLLYIDVRYGSNVIQRLNTELRRGTYSDSFFRKQTGRKLDQLWADFRELEPSPHQPR